MTTAQEWEQKYQGGLAASRGQLLRFLAEDGSNVFDPQKIWRTDKPQIAAGDVNTVLDAGAVGLEWFRLALVRYHRVWDLLKLDGFNQISVPPLPISGALNGAETIDTTTDPNKGEMQRLEGKYYDQQRHMNLVSLQDLATAVSGAALGNGTDPGGSQITSDLSRIAQAVPEYWEGSGGAAASDHLSGFHAHADQKTEYLRAVASALNGLPGVLQQIVADKANFVAAFDSPQCPVAGHAMRLGDEDPVSTIITVAANKGSSGSLSTDREVVAGQFHLAPNNDEDGYKKMATAKCKDWLINHFGPAVREAFTAFVHQCTLADYYIRQAYDPVIKLLDSHDPTPFPKPPGDQNPDNPPNPSIPGPTAPGNAGPTTPASTTPATTPTLTNPAGNQTNPAQQLLSTLASQASQTVQQGLSQTLQQGMSQIQNVAQQGLGSLGGNLSSLGSQIPGVGSLLTDAKGVTAPKELANLSAFGGNLTVSQAANGTITAKVTGPDGKPQEYSMGIKDGVPFLKPGPADSDPAAPDPSEGTGLGKGTDGAGSGVPGGGGSPRPGANTPPEGLGPRPVPGQSVDPHAGKPDSGGGSPTTGPANPDTSQNGMPGMPGMPGGGKPASGAERPPAGIVPPKPMWTTVPGDEAQIPGGPVGPPVAGPELATVGPLDRAPAAPTPGPELATSGPLNAPPPEQASAATPARPSDGVKIEIDMGDAK